MQSVGLSNRRYYGTHKGSGIIMAMDEKKIDIREDLLYSFDERILKMLLKDKTTRKNIIWATDEYASRGAGFLATDEIRCIDIIGRGMIEPVIRPRVVKTKSEQTTRIRDKAEVFTPSWVCNKQNNLVDNAWFGRTDIFNREEENGWITIEDKIVFPDEEGKTWQDYVKANRLEISCGEAPYLASRYDTVTGEFIPVKDRIGLLDRKLRVISENIDSPLDWFNWAKRAVQSVYGYDWQGDNVLLARENLLYTFADFYKEKFTVPAIPEHLIEIAKILAWNIWQMDGVKFVVPNSCKDKITSYINIFNEEVVEVTKCEGCAKNDHSKHNGIYARTYDWVDQHSVIFYSFIDSNFGRKKLNGSKI